MKSFATIEFYNRKVRPNLAKYYKNLLDFKPGVSFLYKKHNIGSEIVPFRGSEKDFNDLDCVLKIWLKNGEPHRINGPSKIWSDDHFLSPGHKEWHVKGKSYSHLNKWFPLNYWICGE